MTRREMVAGAAALAGAAQSVQAQGGVKKYARFRAGGRTAYGVVEGESISEFDGNLFGLLGVNRRAALLRCCPQSEQRRSDK